MWSRDVASDLRIGRIREDVWCGDQTLQKNPMNMNKKSGFTIIEVVMVIGIVAILAGAITPFAIQMIGTRKERAAREELEVIKEAIIGKAKSTEHGEEFTFGFVGDIGNVPNSLDRLKTIGSLPAYSFDTTKDMGAGWRGPYIMEKHGGDFKKDPWGTDYSYSTTPGTNVNLGVQYLAKITNAGPDLTAGTSDDLSVEILEPEVRADIIGLVKDSIGLGVPYVDVDLTYPSNGTLTTASTQTDSSGAYQFADIPKGDRAVIAKPKILYEPNTATTTKVDGKDIKFVVTNYSKSNITVSSLTATYSSDPVAYYREVKINGVRVYNSDKPRTGSGGTVTFTGVPVSASTLAAEPNLMRLQSARVEVPDIKISNLGAGGSLTIELKDFEDVPTGGGNTVDMTGVPFEVTFSDGSVVSFTPRREKI